MNVFSPKKMGDTSREGSITCLEGFMEVFITLLFQLARYLEDIGHDSFQLSGITEGIFLGASAESLESFVCYSILLH